MWVFCLSYSLNHKSNLGSQAAIVGCPRSPCLRISDSYVDSFGDLFCSQWLRVYRIAVFGNFWYASAVAGLAVLCVWLTDITIYTMPQNTHSFSEII